MTDGMETHVPEVAVGVGAERWLDSSSGRGAELGGQDRTVRGEALAHSTATPASSTPASTMNPPGPSCRASLSLSDPAISSPQRSRGSGRPMAAQLGCRTRSTRMARAVRGREELQHAGVREESRTSDHSPSACPTP